MSFEVVDQAACSQSPDQRKEFVVAILGGNIFAIVPFACFLQSLQASMKTNVWVGCFADDVLLLLLAEAVFYVFAQSGWPSPGEKLSSQFVFNIYGWIYTLNCTVSVVFAFRGATKSKSTASTGVGTVFRNS